MATYSVPVSTNTSQEEFTYGFWRDTSETNLQNIRSKGVTKIRMELTVNFGDHETRSAYSQQYARFHDRYVNRETHFCCRKVFQIPGFEERLLAFTDLNSKPWWIGIKFFWIASILTQTWSYRSLFNRAAGRTKYNVTKVIYQDRPADATDMSDLQLYVNLPSSNPSESGPINDAACSILVSTVPLNPPGMEIRDSVASSNLAPTCPPSQPRPPSPPRPPLPNTRRLSNPPLPQRQPRGSNNGAASNAIAKFLQKHGRSTTTRAQLDVEMLKLISFEISVHVLQEPTLYRSFRNSLYSDVISFRRLNNRYMYDIPRSRSSRALRSTRLCRRSTRSTSSTSRPLVDSIDLTNLWSTRPTFADLSDLSNLFCEIYIL